MDRSESMVERVAKALAGGEWREPPFNQLHTDSLNNGWRYKARRAIEAMKEPSEEMEEAADDPFWAAIKQAREWAAKYGKPVSYASGGFSKPMWRAMIDAALK